MFLLDLNLDIVPPIYSEWLCVKDLQKLDTAFTSKSWRETHLHILHLDHLEFESTLSCFRRSEASWLLRRALKSSSIQYYYDREDAESSRFDFICERARKAVTQKGLHLVVDSIKSNEKWLRKIDLHDLNTKFGAAVFSALSTCSQLESVAAWFFSDDEEDDDFDDPNPFESSCLTGLPLQCNLRELTLSVPVLDGLFLTTLSTACPNLEILYLEAYKYSRHFPFDSRFLGYRALKELTFHVSAKEELKAILEKSPNLTSFGSSRVLSNHFRDYDCSRLTECDVNFESNDDLRDFLRRCTALTNLRCERADSVGLSGLSSCCHILSSLDVRGSHVLADDSITCKSSTLVNFVSDNPLMRTFCAADYAGGKDNLLQAFCGRPGLVRLDLNSCHHLSERAILLLLQTCPNLNSISLSRAEGVTHSVVSCLVDRDNLCDATLNCAKLSSPAIALFTRAKSGRLRICLTNIPEVRKKAVKKTVEAVNESCRSLGVDIFVRVNLFL